MPLKGGDSKKAFQGNIHELMSKFMAKGTIGKAHPKSKGAAIRQAVAIAYAKKREE